ncbi:MAG: sulfur oxidation c-type cytochrome SoxX [Betaproteobacteria bacterium]|jgi:sulfur-oxidizing protein SoxX
MNRILWLGVGAAALLTACSTFTPPTREETQQVVKSSFRERSIANLDRLNQTEMQQLCSDAARTKTDVPLADQKRIMAQAEAAVKFPADGKWLGDYKQGERIAQSGVGMQWSDNDKTVNGGNCYACHQISPQELSHGNIGPPLVGYGKLRGTSEPIMKYTWTRIWNSHAFNACSTMPRYGAAGILTEAQIKDVMALLLDPNSPVNK